MKRIEKPGRFKGSPTARERTIYTEAEARERLGEDFAAVVAQIAEGKLVSRLERIEVECREVLRSAGLPCGDDFVLVRGPVQESANLKWRAYSAEERDAAESWPPAGWDEVWAPHRLASGEADAQDYIPHDSIEGYACRILRCITTAMSSEKHALRHAGNGKADLARKCAQLATTEAFEAGILYGEARMAEWYSASQKRDPNADAKAACIEQARRLWTERPELRIGKVVELLADLVPASRYVANGTVRGWIKPFAPATASRRGRPPKQPRKE